ncbi:MAG: clostripain-related cysteine peptidase [Spirochaetota bacterium]
MKKHFLNLSKFMYLFSLILIFILSSCGGGGSDSNDKPSWTIMVYMAADNDLSMYTYSDLNEMISSINNDGNVTIIALCDQDGNSDTNLYKIKYYSTEQLFDATLGVTSNSSELNMGDPQTLSKFIDFCKNNYPADNYALVLWNHGGGWRNKMPQKISIQNLDSIKQYIADKKLKSTTTKSSLSTLLAKKTTLPVKAVCWDETDNNDYLTMAEVKQAVSGKGLTLIGFDACLMGMVEVAYELKDCAQYMVASEETIPGFGWAYDYLLQKFYASSQSPVDLGKAIIDGYKESYEEHGEDGVTLSLIDLSKMDALANAIDTFASSLQSQADKSIITAARHKTLCFTVPHYIDLYHFAQNASSFTGASDVMHAVQDAVVYHTYLDDSGEYGFDNSHGLSIYFPVNKDYDSEYSDYNTSNIDFAQKSWDEHLANYFVNATKHTIETFPNGGGSDTDTYIAVFYYNNGILNYLWEDDDNGTTSLYSKINIPLASGSIYYILCLDIWGDYGYYSILVNQNGGGLSSSTPSSYDVNEPDDNWEQAKQIIYGTVYDYYLSYKDLDWMYTIIP